MKKYKLYKFTFYDGSTYYAARDHDTHFALLSLKNSTKKNIVELASKEVKVEILDSFSTKEECVGAKIKAMKADPNCLNHQKYSNIGLNKYKLYKFTFHDGSTYYATGKAHVSMFLANLKKSSVKKIVALANGNVDFKLVGSYNTKEEVTKAKTELVKSDPKSLNILKSSISGFKKYKLYKITFWDGSTYYSYGDINIPTLLSRIRSGDNKKISNLAKKNPNVEIIDSFDDKISSIRKKRDLINTDSKCINIEKYSNLDLNEYKIYRYTFKDGSTYYSYGGNLDKLRKHKNKKIANLAKENPKIEILDSFDNKDQRSKVKKNLIINDPNCLNKLIKTNIISSPKKHKYKIYKIIFQDGSTYYSFANIIDKLKKDRDVKIASLAKKNPSIEIVDTFDNAEDSIRVKNELIKKDPKCLNPIIRESFIFNFRDWIEM